jgi:hypothetical protein
VRLIRPLDDGSRAIYGAIAEILTPGMIGRLATGRIGWAATPSSRRRLATNTKGHSRPREALDKGRGGGTQQAPESPTLKGESMPTMALSLLVSVLALAIGTFAH